MYSSGRLRLISFLMIFFFGLNTYYFYSIGIPIVQLLGFTIFLLFFFKDIEFELKSFYLINCYILYICTISLVNIFILDNISNVFPFVGFLLCLLIFYFFSNLKENKILFFKKTLEYFVIFILFFWYYQFLLYYIFDTKLDFFVDIVGYPQRTYFGIFNQSFFRPSSLFLEPAMYANFMFLILGYRFVLYEKIFDLEGILILFSILFTMSLYGYAVFFIFILMILIKRLSIKNLMNLILFFIVLGYVAYVMEDNAIIERIVNPLSNQSGEDRIFGSINDFLNADIKHIFFGFGFGNAEVNNFLSGSGLHFLLYNIGIFGLTFTIFIIGLTAKRNRIFLIIFFVLSILNNSSSLTSMFNWMILGLVISIINNKYNEELKHVWNSRNLVKK